MKGKETAKQAQLVEELAAIEHERWSHWQQYLHSVSLPQSDGSLIIPADFVNHWNRLISTQYASLSEDEKASDREQVLRYLPKLLALLKRHV